MHLPLDVSKEKSGNKYQPEAEDTSLGIQEKSIQSHSVYHSAARPELHQCLCILPLPTGSLLQPCKGREVPTYNGNWAARMMEVQSLTCLRNTDLNGMLWVRREAKGQWRCQLASKTRGKDIVAIICCKPLSAKSTQDSEILHFHLLYALVCFTSKNLHPTFQFQDFILVQTPCHCQLAKLS